MSEQKEAPEEAAQAMVDPGQALRGFGYSVEGLKGAWRNEGSFRQEVLAAVVLIPLACFAPVTPVECVLLVASVLLVMVVELLNSAIEAAIDRISLDRHPLAKRAKDTGSAAVLLSIVLALVVWAGILGPQLVAFLGS